MSESDHADDIFEVNLGIIEKLDEASGKIIEIPRYKYDESAEQVVKNELTRIRKAVEKEENELIQKSPEWLKALHNKKYRTDQVDPNATVEDCAILRRLCFLSDKLATAFDFIIPFDGLAVLGVSMCNEKSAKIKNLISQIEANQTKKEQNKNKAI